MFGFGRGRQRELIERLPLSQSATSQHLAVLKEADLVTERRAGTRRLYRANPQTMADLRAFIDDFWTSGLERLRVDQEKGATAAPVSPASAATPTPCSGPRRSWASR